MWLDLPVNDGEAARTLDDMGGDHRPLGIGEIRVDAVPAGKAGRCHRATLGQQGTSLQIAAEGGAEIQAQHRIDLQRATRARYSSSRCDGSRGFSNRSY